MKKFFLIYHLLFLLCCSAFSQIVISYEKINILSLSTQYTIRQSIYNPNQAAFLDANTLAMASLQERYDKGFYFVKYELNKVINLKLLNKENISLLQTFKNKKMPFWKSISNADLSKEEVVQKCISDITEIYKFRDIIAEIKLLQNCNNELTRIKIKDPDNYINSKRYKSISITLNNLESCKSNDIINLSWEQTELGLK